MKIILSMKILFNFVYILLSIILIFAVVDLLMFILCFSSSFCEYLMYWVFIPTIFLLGNYAVVAVVVIVLWIVMTIKIFRDRYLKAIGLIII